MEMVIDEVAAYRYVVLAKRYEEGYITATEFLAKIHEHCGDN